VATIVTKLFAAVGSATAVFGRKDYQQLKIIERLARDLLFPITIDGHPIVREKGGLAMSSRNRYLSDRERVVALSLCGALKAAMSLHASGERKAQALIARMKSELESAGARIDYVSVADADSLEPIDDVVGERALLAVAAYVGQARLIDNAVISEDGSPR
jgi:pantoate--beta-alanine ligase